MVDFQCNNYRLLDIPVPFVVEEQVCVLEIPYRALKVLPWSIAYATAARSPVIAHCELFLSDFGLFWLIQAAGVVGEPFCDLEYLCWILKPY